MNLLLATAVWLSVDLTVRVAVNQASEPLHVRIDRLVEQSLQSAPLRRASDQEFMRRVYLDLAGRIPSSTEARRFLDSPGDGRRVDLIERLLASADHPRRMRELFHVLLMERRGDHEEWEAFLRAAFDNNLPWDAIVRAILKPEAAEERKRGAAFFMTQRLVKEGAFAPIDIPGLTRDVGRLFAGVDLQCAQCHDHIDIDDYLQEDFQGLHMIFENVQIRRDVQFPAIAEKLMAEPKQFKSVFDQVAVETQPRIPGAGEVAIPKFERDKAYLEPPDRKKRTIGVPKFSPLSELATRLASRGNQLFRNNSANRLWFIMMGRGLVEPLDLQHAANPPTHPELLELVASEFAEQRFDIRWLLRELALTDTYQRSSLLPPDAATEPSYAVACEKPLSAEQLFWSVLTATGEIDHWRTATGSDTPLELERLVAQNAELKSLRDLMIATFANPPKEPETSFAPSVKGALFWMHDGTMQSLLTPKPGNLVDRLSKLDQTGQVVSEIYLSVLSRSPEQQELASAVEYLEGHKARRVEAIGNLIWAMLTSSEFVLNH